ncbi:glycoside hydrolase family 61 protein [Thermothelomyces thermophilus ATCC 42464]|uniref:lytic cellulose monooxygenase (C4-dehydrogenating) n=1 Tax=Thermothelomyces thermophilus (strain ATCC 42464 / BCRC 31852 / DSM 1799) TaxID=573729 RepID=G2QFY5_THET4|nr:glycoside hydrolase family 61 protein [Thermothelomyces thermophilus ATCC 42464]AEO59482.1 glycoside hydrolase family 61 protein [Thermothelomyces thermophilus ATCC 42464]
MKLATLLAALTLGVADLSVGSRKFGVYEHIRKNTNYNSPVTDLSDTNLRCNVGGGSGTSTTVLDVKAGDSFTFFSDVAVYHQGPISLCVDRTSMYMSKTPGSAQDYDGSGDCFKIYDWGPTFNGGQASWPTRNSYEYSILKCIRDGEYLLRIQSLAIHNPGALPQFYISCAQVNVTGGGTIYFNFHSYIVPGPAVFKC